MTENDRLKFCEIHTYLYKSSFILILNSLQGRRNGFQSGGAMEHWKGMSATMVFRQEKFFNYRGSRMAKTVTFWPWWQPCFCFETHCLFPFFPYFIFATKKGGGPWSPGSPRCRWPWVNYFSFAHIKHPLSLW